MEIKNLIIKNLKNFFSEFVFIKGCGGLFPCSSGPQMPLWLLAHPALRGPGGCDLDRRFVHLALTEGGQRPRMRE